jgi:hypothetical protein
MTVELRFQRFECKYLVTEAVAQSVRRFIAPVVQPDEHARHRPDCTYPIVSLYLDSPRLALGRETIEGLKDRFKLRVRAYDDDPAGRLFLEIKRRRNLVVQKQRCPLPRAQALALLAGRLEPPPALAPAARVAFVEFARLMLQSEARPVTLVRYDREAYVGRFDQEARVTFDRGLRAARTSHADVRMAGPDFTVVEGRHVILEIKFNNRCPAWLDAVIKTHALRRRSYSKYCHALAASHRRGSAATA